MKKIKIIEQKGLVSMAILVGVLLVAVVIPVTTKLVEQNQENRSKAVNYQKILDGVECDSNSLGLKCSKNDGNLWKCVAGSSVGYVWFLTEDCSGRGCLDNKCNPPTHTPSCSLLGNVGNLRCNSDGNVEQCQTRNGSTVQWYLYKTCGDGCSNGKCLNTCKSLGGTCDVDCNGITLNAGDCTGSTPVCCKPKGCQISEGEKIYDNGFSYCSQADKINGSLRICSNGKWVTKNCENGCEIGDIDCNQAKLPQCCGLANGQSYSNSLPSGSLSLCKEGSKSDPTTPIVVDKKWKWSCSEVKDVCSLGNCEATKIDGPSAEVATCSINNCSVCKKENCVINGCFWDINLNKCSKKVGWSIFDQPCKELNRPEAPMLSCGPISRDKYCCGEKCETCNGEKYLSTKCDGNDESGFFESTCGCNGVWGNKIQCSDNWVCNATKTNCIDSSTIAVCEPKKTICSSLTIMKRCNITGTKWISEICLNGCDKNKNLCKAKCGSKNDQIATTKPNGTEACELGTINFASSDNIDGVYRWTCGDNTDYAKVECMTKVYFYGKCQDSDDEWHESGSMVQGVLMQDGKLKRQTGFPEYICTKNGWVEKLQGKCNEEKINAYFKNMPTTSDKSLCLPGNPVEISDSDDNKYYTWKCKGNDGSLSILCKGIKALKIGSLGCDGKNDRCVIGAKCLNNYCVSIMDDCNHFGGDTGCANGENCRSTSSLFYKCGYDANCNSNLIEGGFPIKSIDELKDKNVCFKNNNENYGIKGEEVGIKVSLDKTNFFWTCRGKNGSGENCIMNVTIDGQCNSSTVGKVLKSIPTDSEACSGGTPIWIDKKGEKGIYRWKCDGSATGGGISEECTAYRQLKLGESGCDGKNDRCVIGAKCVVNKCISKKDDCYIDGEKSIGCSNNESCGKMEDGTGRFLCGYDGYCNESLISDSTLEIRSVLELNDRVVCYYDSRPITGSDLGKNIRFLFNGGKPSFNWICQGKNWGTSNGCSINQTITGACNPSFDGKKFNKKPTGKLCNIGETKWIDETGDDGDFNWKCLDIKSNSNNANANDGTNCKATRLFNIGEKGCDNQNKQCVANAKCIKNYCVSIMDDCNHFGGDTGCANGENCRSTSSLFYKCSYDASCNKYLEGSVRFNRVNDFSDDLALCFKNDVNDKGQYPILVSEFGRKNIKLSSDKTKFTWTCNGKNGTSQSCSLTVKADGQCNSSTVGKVLKSTPTDLEACSGGTPIWIDKKGEKGIYRWKCDGSATGGGISKECSAYRKVECNSLPDYVKNVDDLLNAPREALCKVGQKDSENYINGVFSWRCFGGKSKLNSINCTGVKPKLPLGFDCLDPFECSDGKCIGGKCVSKNSDCNSFGGPTGCSSAYEECIQNGKESNGTAIFKCIQTGICGGAKNGSFYNLNELKEKGLCLSGKSQPLSPTLVNNIFSWKCLATDKLGRLTLARNEEIDDSCTAKLKIDGKCSFLSSDAGRASMRYAPTGGWCAAGKNPQKIITDETNNSYYWICGGVNGGINSEICWVKRIVDGQCNTQLNGMFKTLEEIKQATLCNSNPYSVAEEEGYNIREEGNLFKWICKGYNSGTWKNCSYPKTLINTDLDTNSNTNTNLDTDLDTELDNDLVEEKINGVCNPDRDGRILTYLPSDNLLCSVGVPIWLDKEARDGKLNWQCDGLKGGLSDICEATLNKIETKPKISIDLSFVGVKPNSYCLSDLKELSSIMIKNLETGVTQIINQPNLTLSVGKTNMAGEQVFRTIIEVDGKFSGMNSNNHIELSPNLGLDNIMCINNQSRYQVTNCNLNLIRTGIFNFRNYGLVLGDINNDGMINTLDFSSLKSGISRGIINRCGQIGDLNFDGLVNDMDLGILFDRLN